MSTVTRTIEDVLAQVFDQACDIDDARIRAEQRDAFIFHMTDWRDDLQRLARLYEEPVNVDDQQAKDTISAVLYHALGHLIAAARLYDYVPDPFGETATAADNS